jgi:hypothetical protein
VKPAVATAGNESWNSWRLRINWHDMMVVGHVTATWRQYSGLTVVIVCGVRGSVPVGVLEPILCYFPNDYLVRILLGL